MDNRDKGVISGKSSIGYDGVRLDNSGGQLNSAGNVTLAAQEIQNAAGRISSQGDLTAVIGLLQQQGGALVAQGNLELTGTTLDNSNGGLVGANKALTLKVDDVDNRAGEISSSLLLSVTGQQLDNSGDGKVLAAADLSLVVANLINQSRGQIAAKGSADVSGSVLNNSGGSLAAFKGLVITLDDALINNQGLIASRDGLTIHADNSLNNQLGTVTADGELKITAGAMVNRSGDIVGKADATVTVKSLDNQQGRLIATGSLVLTAEALDNRKAGLLGSTQALTLTVDDIDNREGELTTNADLLITATKVDNGDGGKVFSGRALTLVVDELINRNIGQISSNGVLTFTGTRLENRQQGNISGLGAIKVTTDAFDNSQGGRLISGDTLSLIAGQVTNQDDGRIGSQGAMTASVTGLDQQGGRLFSNTSLSLDLNNGQLNNRNGLINSPGTLLLKQLKGVDNQGGEISSAEAFTLTAQSLDNSDGKLLSNAGLTLRIADALDNVKGLIGAASLDAHAAALNNRGGSLISRGGLDLVVDGALHNDAMGLINSQGNLTLVAAEMDSSGGEVSAKGDIDLTLSSLTQVGGRLMGEQAVTVDLANGDLDNRNGMLTAKGPLTLKRLRDLHNQGGEISSNLGFEINARVVNNSAGKLITSQLLTVNGTTLDNQKGLISGWQGLTVTGDSLDNRDSGTLSSREGDVDVELTGALLNSNAGALVSKGGLSVKSTSVDNSEKGILSSAAGQTLTVSDTLDNGLGGLIDSGAALNITAGSLSNVGGEVNAQQAIDATVAQLDNTGGTIAGNGALTLDLLGALTNTRGKLAGTGPVKIKGVTALDNQSGQIASQGLLTLLTQSLNNSKGTIAARGALQITASGAVLNRDNGLIYSQNAGLSVKAASLTGDTGAMLSQNDLNLDIIEDLDNQSGKIIAQNGAVIVKSGSANNRGGVISAKGLASITGDSLDNGAGQIAAERIALGVRDGVSNRAGIVESATELTINAGSLDNQAGRLRSLGAIGGTRFQIGGLLDNRNGVLETANTDLSLVVGSFQNAAGELNHAGRGTFDISTENVIAAGGHIATGGTLDLNVDTWTNSSVIQAQRLNLNVNNFSQTTSGQLLATGYLQARGGNWSNDGLIASDGVLDMKLTGTYAGKGRLTSVGGLDLGAARIELGTTSSVAGGGETTVKIGGQLINAGRLTSNAGLTVEAGSISNNGTLGAAQNLALQSPSLMNDGGLIFSGADMKIGVGSFTNQTGDVYGLGNVVIQGFGSAAQANQVSNLSGSMESGGAFTIKAGSFANRTSGSDGVQNFTLGRTLTSGFIAVLCRDCLGDDYDVDFIAREVFDGKDTDTTASSTLISGGDFAFDGGDFLNSKSTVSAQGNITINASNLKNIGSVSGIIERTRTYRTGKVSDGTINRFMPNVVAYNQRNNPDFPNLYYVNGSGGFSLGTVVPVRVRGPGHDGGWEWATGVQDTQTGTNVTNTLPGYGFGGATPPSLYDPNNLVALPTALNNLALVSDTEVVRAGGSAVRNAVIQAGGNVSITAAKDLQNSVIHADYGTTGGTNRVGDTRATGTGATVIRINAQLPPDLAQQQVNPLSLPGFTLPAGQNGLFRLNGQGTNDGGTGTALPPGWSITSVSDNVNQPGTGPRNLALEGVPSTALPGLGSSVASNLDVSVTANGPLNVGLTLDHPINRVTGLPEIKVASGSHKYLIETNPVLTDLKQFMSSDYLLSNLGYDPDQSAKRLGDGLYEQRLIQQAVVARTGQRFIDGQTTDEGLFKYLMNNAIASKEALDLSLGVSLTSQQVAALTHDIVWLEEHEVNGEKVLVPVLYLAQAEGRLGPTGALIAGKDVSLIAGQNLDNVGTLKASNNLSAVIGSDLMNSGLIQAGNRLDVLAVNNVINKSGGILAGRDVDISALTGDVLNERTIISQERSTRFGTQHHDYADTAARIEAANDLSVSAGQDINVIGAELQSGRDMSLDAGRDLNVVSTQVENSIVHDSKHYSSDVTQLGASLSAGRDISAQADRNLNLIASQIDARRDIALAAAEDMTISSAADEEHSLSKSKKKTRQEDHVSQVMSGVTAGGDVALSAGKDMAVISSRITAGDEAYLVAGDNLDILAEQDTDYSLYDKKKKGSFGSKKTQRDEVTDVKNIGSEISSGGNLILVSGGNQHYQGAKLSSGNDLTLNSGGSISFEAVKDLHQESHEKSNSSMAWYSMKGKGSTNETFIQTTMAAQGELAIRAAEKISIDVKQVDQKTVHEAIEAMVAAEPGLAWIKQAEANGQVDWRLVKEIHESWKYDSAGLGAASALIIAIVASMVLGPLSGAIATNFTVGTVNNGGDLGAGLKATVSKDAIKGYATQIATGYALNGMDQLVSGWNTSGALILKPDGILNPGYSSSMLDWGTVSQNVLRSTAHALAVGSINTAINGGSLIENLGSALVSEGLDLTAAFGNKQVGDLAVYLNVDTGSAQKILMHALLGGALSAAKGGDFKTGALAGAAVEGLNAITTEALGKYLDSRFLTDEQFKVGTAQIIGVIAGALGGGDPAIASWVAGNAERYNQQLHREAAERLDKGFKTLHEEGKYLNLQPGDVLEALQKIVDGEKNPSNLNPEVVAFLNEFPPAMLRDLFLEPTQKERLIELGIEIGFPTPTGKGQAAMSISKIAINAALDALTKAGLKTASSTALKLTQDQLERKFKHAVDFGISTTKKNPDTILQFGIAINSHMLDAATVQKGTYGFVKDSKIFFNPGTNNVVVLDSAGTFVTGFKIYPNTSQYVKFMADGVLR